MSLDVIKTLELDEGMHSELVSILNKYVRLLEKEGLDKQDECGCCTLQDSARAAFMILVQLGGTYEDNEYGNLIDTDLQELAIEMEVWPEEWNTEPRESD